MYINKITLHWIPDKHYFLKRMSLKHLSVAESLINIWTLTIVFFLWREAKKSSLDQLSVLHERQFRGWTHWVIDYSIFRSLIKFITRGSNHQKEGERKTKIPPRGAAGGKLLMLHRPYEEILRFWVLSSVRSSSTKGDRGCDSGKQQGGLWIDDV